MKRVYISGPMTDRAAYNAPAFEYAMAQWADAGYEPHTPFEANSVVWKKHHGRAFDPYFDKCNYDDPLLREMFAEDIRLMLSCDVVAVLDGWRKSKGVARELSVADLFGLPILDGATFEPVAETILEEAQRLVHGDRGDSYGHPIIDYGRTGRIWGAILGIPDIDPRLCCLMMAGVKISREVQGHKRDNLTDLAGYAECAQMVAERQATT